VIYFVTTFKSTTNKPVPVTYAELQGKYLENICTSADYTIPHLFTFVVLTDTANLDLLVIVRPCYYGYNIDAPANWKGGRRKTSNMFLD
jgi:hypothetical protein